MNKMVYIYSLKDPRDYQIKYIGKASDVNKRYKQHIENYTNQKSLKSSWVLSILRSGLLPILEIVEICDESKWQEREQYWISFYDTTNIEKGYNKAKGGRGNPGLPVSEETRQKIREKNKGFTPEAREIIRLKAIGRPLSESHANLARSNGMKIAKAILQYSTSGELLNEFPSIIEASRSTNTDRRTIQRQLSGESKLDGSLKSSSNVKFIWKRK